MANSVADGDSTDIESYSMHVSARYLELTTAKLELTRLPREIPLPQERRWDLGTSKATLEPLIDFWLEQYSWREQESQLNETLPQFRTTITTSALEPENLRIHFAHKRSFSSNAIPLLFCHGWPGSFVEVAKCIDSLCDPIETPRDIGDSQPCFHVVVPSIPGFGFSDATQREGFGLRETAEVFEGLMRRLGYERFLVLGNGWGFKIARMIALEYPNSCAGVFTMDPMDLPLPLFSINKPAWLAHQVAKFTKARFAWCAFGYVPSDFMNSSSEREEKTATISGSEGLAITIPQSEPIVDLQPSTTVNLGLRPQTLSYGLCDSPAGLLSLLLDAITPKLTAATTLLSSWSNYDILNWTMMHWLPGPEASLRWLYAASREKSFTSYSPVPLGISAYKGGGSPMWAQGWHDLKWVRRRTDRVPRVPAWEQESDLVTDLREFVKEGGRERWLDFGGEMEGVD